jgi:hypothetical protein
VEVIRDPSARSIRRIPRFGIGLAVLLGSLTALAQPAATGPAQGAPPPDAVAAPDATSPIATLPQLIDAGDLELTVVGVNGGDDVELRMRNAAGRVLRVQVAPGATSFEIEPAGGDVPIALSVDGGAGLTLDLPPGGTASVVVPQLGNGRLQAGSVVLARSGRKYQAAKFVFSAAAPERHGPALAMAPCVPACAEGMACLGGQCGSLCAAPCPAGQSCTDEGKCSPPVAAVPPPAPAPPQSAPAESSSSKDLSRAESAKSPEEGWRRHRIEVGYFGGWGVDAKSKIADVQVATTVLGVTTNSVESIYTRFGGGNGFLITYGFSPIQQLELTASFGAQWATIDKGDVEPAKGNFGRGLTLATAYYVLPFVAHGHGPTFLIGAGGGIHNGGKLDLDLTDITGGTHSVLTFNTPAPGWHIVGGLEQREDPVSIGFRAGYYSVAYELKSMTENGVAVPLNTVRSEFRNPSGDAFNLTLYLAFFL